MAKKSKTKQKTAPVDSGQWTVDSRHKSNEAQRHRGTKDSAKCEVQSVKTTHHAPRTTHHALSIIYCLLPILLLVISILLAYSNTFNASFHFDDISNITENSNIKNLYNFSKIIRDTDRPIAMIVNALNYHFGKLNVHGYHYVNIAIHILTAIVLYFILLNTLVLPVFSGKYIKKDQFLQHGDVPTLPDSRNVDTSWYRNNYVTTQSVVTRTVLVPTLRVGTNIKHNYDTKKYFLAFMVSSIFALHPIQTQTVTYIIQGRMAGLATLFYLSALLFFILGTKAQGIVRSAECRVQSVGTGHRACPTPNSELRTLNSPNNQQLTTNNNLQNTEHRTQNTDSVSSYQLSNYQITKLPNRQSPSAISHSLPPIYYILSTIYYLLAILSSALGMATKEIAITAPLIILIYDYFFIANGSLKELKKRTLIHLGLFLTIGIALYLTFAVTFGKHETEIGFGVREFSPLQYLYTQFRVIMYYIFLMLLPINQNIDYDWRISKSFFEPSVVICLILIITILIISVKIYKKHKLLTFCILCFFITLAPESSIIPIKDVIFEHRLYLPSLFFILFVVLLIYDMVRNRHACSLQIYHITEKACRGMAPDMPNLKQKTEYLVYCVALSLMVVLGVLTYNRNIVWETELSLWQDCVKKSPNKALPNNNLAAAYDKLGKYKTAFKLYKKAIRANPYFVPSSENLGLLYIKVGQPEKALPVLRNLVKLVPTDALGYYYLGNAYSAMDKYKESIEVYKKAIKLEPTSTGAYNNLGVSYGFLNKHTLAIDILKKSIKLNPNAAEPHSNLGNIYMQLKKYKTASNLYKKAIQLDEKYTTAYTNLGNAYMALKDYDLAIKFYKKTLTITPNNFDVYKNIGTIYEKMGKYDLAINAYKQILEINPNYVYGYLKVGLLYLNIFKDRENSIYYLTNALSYLLPQDAEKIEAIIVQIKAGKPVNINF